MGTHSTYQLGYLSRTEVNEREEGVVAIYLPIESLKTCSGLEPVPRCEPSTYQSISRWRNHCTIQAGMLAIWTLWFYSVFQVKLPDLEFIVNLGDWPLENRKLRENPLPIFSWCGSEDTRDIVMPTYDITEATLEMMGR